MSKPRYKWWGYVKWVIRDYPDKCRELQMMQTQSCTANYSGSVRGSEAQRNTENTALRGFSGQREREFSGVEQAIEETRRMKNGAERLKLIDLVFFSKTHTLSGAALACYVGERTALEWHGDFIRCVAKHMGLLDS